MKILMIFLIFEISLMYASPTRKNVGWVGFTDNYQDHNHNQRLSTTRTSLRWQKVNGFVDVPFFIEQSSNFCELMCEAFVIFLIINT
jgi:hypothetical protein